MKTSAKGRKFIERHEGLRLCPYKVGSFEQYWTIGYGHYGPDVKAGVCISASAASSLLRKDIREEFDPLVEDALADANGVKQQEFDALMSLAYNIPAAVSDTTNSTLARRLRSKEGRSFTSRCKVYREELPKWVKAGGETLPGLVERRRDEIRLACRGKYQ